MRQACDRHRKKGAAAVFVGGSDGEKVTLIAMVADGLAKGGTCSAAEWVKAVAPIVGGSGGGKPTLAQAGGKDGAKLPEALAAAAEWIRGRLA
jgi:alanyl-tRNA synthetase